MPFAAKIIFLVTQNIGSNRLNMNLDKLYTFYMCQPNCFKLVCFSDSWAFLLGISVFAWMVAAIHISMCIKKLNFTICRVDGMIYV